MPAFVAFDSEKGGTGKSTAARMFATWCFERKLSVAVIDADGSNPDVGRWVSGAMPVHFVNIRKEGGWIEASDLAHALLPKLGKNGVCILNCPANAASSFPDQRAVMYQAVKEMGFAPTLAWVLDTGDDVVNMLATGLGPITTSLTGRLVFRNLIWGESADFKVWENSRIRKRFLQIGREDDFPRLWPRIADMVRFADGPQTLRTRGDAKMGVGEHLVLLAWLAQLDKLWRTLSPTMKIAA